MRGIVTVVAILAISIAPHVSSGQAINRLGAGLDITAATGDLDGGLGLSGYFRRSVANDVFVQGGMSIASGDFEVSSADMDFSGSYTTFGAEFLAGIEFNNAPWIPYLAMGGSYNLNGYDDLDVSSKLGMLFAAGAIYEVNELMGIDVSLLYRSLRPDSIDDGISEINMDALILRAGVSWKM